MKLILPYFKQNLVKIITGILCMIIVDLSQLIIPHIIKNAVDILAQGSFDHFVLIKQCLIISFLGLFMMVLRYFWRVLLMGSSRDLEKGIREQLFSHILSLDMKYFNTVKTGDIMAHATSDINHIRLAFGMGLIALTDSILLGGATITIMLWMNAKLTLLALIPMPFLVIIIKYLGNKMHLYHTNAQESYSALTELVRESFFGIRILKVFNFENLVSQKVKTFSIHYFKKNFKRAFVTSLLRPLMGFIFNLSTFLVLFYGGFLVIQKTLSPGDLVAFIQYLGILAWPVIAIGWMTNLFQRGLSSLKRINKLLDSRPEVRNIKKPEPCDNLYKKITFNNVSFAYESSKDVLCNITMQINPGETIGISGPPGSGKTSFAQLIPRLYNNKEGNILIDNKNLKNIDIEFLRQNIAFMPQESFLFSGTIKENILMGKSIDENQLDQILEITQLSTTIDEMPSGLETIVGERGITLSGGQKQRIALARTLILPKQIIILDDPISQMDTHTASKVISGINKINKNSTFIIISHRISALAACDCIYILNNGIIEDKGRHKELLLQNQFYKDSYIVQQFEEAHAS